MLLVCYWYISWYMTPSSRLKLQLETLNIRIQLSLAIYWFLEDGVNFSEAEKDTENTNVKFKSVITVVRRSSKVITTGSMAVSHLDIVDRRNKP